MTRTKSAGTHNKASIYGVIGASGTGKSSYIKGELLRKFKVLLIWSPLEDTDQYGKHFGGVVVTKVTEFIAAIKAKNKVVVFWPKGDSKTVKSLFDWFCRVVFEVTGAHVLVEELSQVTMPSWAPPAWKKLSTAGRHRGLTLIGVSQRPANIDKDFLGNCTEIRCYRVNYENDAKVMGGVLRLKKEWGLLNELQNFHYYHKNPDLSVTTGVNKPL